MGITERREAEKEALKHKIYDVASKLIVEHGYEKLSIRKLASEIEYSPAVIYNYFRNKDDIIKAITFENYNRIYKELMNIDIESMAPKTALRSGLLKLAQLIIDRREHFRATLLSGVTTMDDGSDDNDAMNMLINLLNKGVESGDFDIADTRYTAYLITTGIFGMISMLVLNNVYDDSMINSMINGHVELIIKGVVNNEKR